MSASTANPQTPQQRHRPRTIGELIDAKAASIILGVPHTWLLAQARQRKIPHHRLGHYVRFDPQELADWLRETRIPAHKDIRHEA